MNINFLNRAAIIVLLVATCLVAFWRYEVTVVQPRQSALLTSFQTDIRNRDFLKDKLHDLKNIRTGIELIASESKLDESPVILVEKALNNLKSADPRQLAGTQKVIKQFDADVAEFLKITNQLERYEVKTKEFINGFHDYFQSFENEVERWKKDAAGAILNSAEVTNTIPVEALTQKIDTLQKIIPELAAFEQKLLNLQGDLNHWIAEINTAPTIEEKQAVFSQKQYILKAFADHFETFNGYVLKTLEQEQVNGRQIANQILNSMDVIEKPLQERYGSLNNAVDTLVIQAKIQERQYQDIKRVVVVGTFVILIGLFLVLAVFMFRFEKGMNLFNRQTAKASEDSKELVASLQDHSNLIMDNFELTKVYKDGLENVAQGFADRQINLQNVDQLVRDTDLLVQESRTNFLTIKEEFYYTEKVSQEIVQLTGALDGVAQQMTVIAERAILNVANNHQQAVGKQDTIDELKYLASRIRHAVRSTHDALENRKDKINEAKAKFELIETNMNQMTDNTRQALKEIALARLEHSQEVSRINEILDDAKSKSLQIAEEITALNNQIRDFSVLSKHLQALHELAIKASALNAQSLLVETKQQDESAEVLVKSSRQMNDYIQEYFTKVFESDVLKPAIKKEALESGLSETSAQEPAPRIKETISNT